ncbi:hypothetical protein [Actinoplanes rectilineatus]|uniref:hypothetical protein n=1 Tax=Actinoplanes rectilineatus TaxID=113571 RepID=UPI0005F292EC|nr:hypothetical protein [Actinoplanes rectilineatus]
MSELENAVRTTVRDLADEAPPAHDLAAVARTRGRRIRRHRHAALGALAVVLVAATAMPYALLRRDPPAPVVDPAPAVSPVPSASAGALPDFSGDTPYQLPGGAVVTMLTKQVEVQEADGTIAPGDPGYVALDRTTGTYRQLDVTDPDLVPAPDGRTFAVMGLSGRVDVVDASGDRKARIDTRGSFTAYSGPQ